MAETYCPNLSGDPAIVFAEGGYNTFMTLAPRTFNAAVSQAQSLGRFEINPVSFNANFDVTEQLAPFQRPPRPVLDAERFIFNPPAGVPAAPQFDGREITLDTPPEFNIADPIVSYGARPETPNIVAPVPPAALKPLVVPDAPAYDLPPLPSLVDLNLPSVPTLEIPKFDGKEPDFIEPVISENWNFTPEKYTSDLLEKVKRKVSGMMDGSTGLEPIESALFSRGRDRIEVETRRDIDTRISEFAARGFSEPNGVLAQALDEIIQAGNNRKADLSRDITIQSYQESLLNLRFAVQQGVALEQVAVNLFLEEQRMALQSAQFLRETSIALLNARVSVYQARLAGYQAGATVYEARIRAALAQVELYRAQIEGEKARGEINEQRVRIYAEQVRSLNVMADFYRAQVSGVQAQADVQRSQIEAFKAEVDAFSARWRAFGEEYSAYRSQIEAENSKVQVHSNLVSAYATRVQATNNVNRGRIDGEQLRIQQHGQRLQTWNGLLDKLRADIQAESSRISSESQRADALARIYTADAAVEASASASSDRVFQSAVERARAQADVSLENARIAVQQNQSITSLQLEALKTQSNVLSQLAASALSAMNFSASVSSSRGESRSCSTNFSWSGEVEDA